MMVARFTALTACAVVFLCAGACTGRGDLALVAGQAAPPGSKGPAGGNGAGTAAPAAITVPEDELRRLSRAEIAASLHELLGLPATEALVLLPEDSGAPFDNDYTKQEASAVFVESMDVLAEQLARRTLLDAAAKKALLPCQPTAPDDPDCLGLFISRFGRQALRRPLTSTEVQEFLAFREFGLRTGRFDTAVELVIRALLTDPEFLYRVEMGTPVAGRVGEFKLTPFELASRLSFTLWGRTPPVWLLDLAETGKLSTAEDVRAAATQLLADPKAKEQVERFHAMWLGFAALPFSAELNEAFVTETTTLVDKVVFTDRADYFELFSSGHTWANDLLISHYGLSAPAGSGFRWVSLAGSRRKGVLGHGALLSNGARQQDTSPTRRGLWIRERLFCQDIPPPPPEANADVPPESTNGSTCKKDRYVAHATVGSCASCHKFMDPVGFGLENFDSQGRFRTHEVQDASCTISGDGELSGIGGFNGADGLADLLTVSGELEPCIVKQVFRFAHGRREQEADHALLVFLEEQFKSKGRRFDLLLLDLVSNETFRHRRTKEG